MINEQSIVILPPFPGRLTESKIEEEEEEIGTAFAIAEKESGESTRMATTASDEASSGVYGRMAGAQRRARRGWAERVG